MPGTHLGPIAHALFSLIDTNFDTIYNACLSVFSSLEDSDKVSTHITNVGIPTWYTFIPTLTYCLVLPLLHFVFKYQDCVGLRNQKSFSNHHLHWDHEHLHWDLEYLDNTNVLYSLLLLSCWIY